MLIGALALLALAFLVVLAPLIWAAIVAFAPETAPLSSLVTLGRYGLVSIILVLALVIAHKWLPAERRTFAQIAPGIALTVVLSLIFSVAFGAYLAQYARNYVSTYGGLASVMIALVFLYAWPASSSMAASSMRRSSAGASRGGGTTNHQQCHAPRAAPLALSQAVTWHRRGRTALVASL